MNRASMGGSDPDSRREVERDLTDLSRAFAMLSACNKAVIRSTDETRLIEEICGIATGMGGYSFAWVGYADPGPERRIIPAAFAGEHGEYLRRIRLSYDEVDISGKGPSGRSIRSGEAEICEDVHDADDAFEWKAEALKRGFRSIACLPLKNEGGCFGVLALYSPEPNAVSADERRLFQELADNLAYGISALRDRSQREITQNAIVKVAQAVSHGAGKQFYNLLTKNMVSALGATGGVIGKLNRAEHSVETLSFVLDGMLQENIRYPLRGTPCERLGAAKYCIFESGVSAKFPDDHLLVNLGIEGYAGVALLIKEEPVGVLSVVFKKPIQDPPFVKSVLTIFAERVASEMDRQETDSRIRWQASLLDKARDAIFTCDLDGGITYWNRSAERLYGHGLEEVSGKSARDMLHRDATAYDQAHEATLRDGEWLGELGQAGKDGRPLTVESRWTLVRDGKGKPVSILFINTDVTEHRQLEQQWLRAQRLESIGTLAGGIAHDLNNVLTPISMSIELLRDSVRDDRGCELLETIALCSRRGADMVGQILSFARGVEGRRLSIPTGEFINGLAKIIRDTFPKGIRLELELAPDLWPITGDPTQLHQVLLNLCLNARDAMPDGGTLRITASNIVIDRKEADGNLDANPGTYVRIGVEDTGHGMLAEVSGRIYDPFFTTKEPGKGTGLGLPTSLAIVKSHGGFIRSRSEPGAGTLFEIHLPAVTPKPASTRTAAESAGFPRGHGESILIIDDEPDILVMTSEILGKYGYVPITVGSGREALEIYKDRHAEIRAVITDMMMPDLDGAGTIQALTHIDPYARIIAVSGIHANSDVAQAAGNGSLVYFLEKPFTASMILNALQVILADKADPPP